MAADGTVEVPNDVKKQFTDFKEEVMKEATHILQVRMPQKILYFNKLVSKTMTLNPSPIGGTHSEEDMNAAIANPWLRFVPDKTPPLPHTVHTEPAVPSETTAASEEAAAGRLPAKRPRMMIGSEKEAIVYPTGYPAHPQIFKMTEEVKGEVAEIIEMAGSMKLFIQLNVPRIEGGNNFGVQIQEEAIQELARVEDGAFTVCTAIVEYFSTRAALISKIIKYPNVQDYKEALRELDEKKWMFLKVTRIDMRNNYAMLYDLLSKNWERVVKPRTSEGNSMIY